MGYDNMEMEEQRASDACEQLERDIIEIEAMKRETWKKSPNNSDNKATLI
jgi:hypothetical protein